MSEQVPEKRPEQTLAAAGPAVPADDRPPLSLKIYSHCGTSAGTHTAATRDGRGLELRLQHRPSYFSVAARFSSESSQQTQHTIVLMLEGCVLTNPKSLK